MSRQLSSLRSHAFRNFLIISPSDVVNTRLLPSRLSKPFFSIKSTKLLYGLKSSSAAFRAYLAETLVDIGFKSRRADPDGWYRTATKPNGEEYYEYLLAYVDDILCMSHDAVAAMEVIRKDFKLKKMPLIPQKHN